MSENEKQDPVEMEDVEISPLSDEDLEGVAGGEEYEGCSCSTTGGSCTGSQQLDPS